jgi:predicted AAA+ superfamily ATPase
MTFRQVKRLFQEPKTSYFLFGPRGTGKSTLAGMRHEDALLIDLRLHKERLRFSANPDQLLSLVQGQPGGKTIIIDEIQKVPALLPIVHVLIEEKRQWKFILTGSNARKLKRDEVDLLGGRALKKVLHPFMAAEIKEDFRLDDAIKYGLLPLRFGVADPFETLQSYISLYLEEEVKMEGLVRHIEPFTRFLQAMSFSHGEILNVSNISRDCHVKRTTVDSWISILEDMLIGYQISVFTERAKRELSAQPKFYFFDAGVYQSLRPYSLSDVKTIIDGHALEGLIAQHLVAWQSYTTQKHTLHFWRTRSGVEVDFIVLGPLGFWAIEVKHSDHIQPSDLNHLRSFTEDYPEARPLLLYRGKERLMMKHILCLPVEDFLRELIPDRPLDHAYNA